MHTCRVIWLIFMTVMLFMSGHIVADELKEGVWTGTFLNLHGKRYKIRYNVSYKKESDQRKLQILMINLDLEPMSEYTYQLTDIKLEDRKLNFKIFRENEIKQCTLNKQEDNKFSGRCQSDKATVGQTSRITMIPPPEEQ